MSETAQKKEQAAASAVNAQVPKALSKKEQRRKTVYAVLVMLIPFSVFMYMIFGGKTLPPQPEDVDGYNTTTPEGRSQPIVKDKRKAYESAQQESRQDQRVKAVAQNPFLLLEGKKIAQEKEVAAEGDYEQSQAAYRAATRQVQSFYNQPSAQPQRQVDSLRRQVEQLQEQLTEQRAVKVDPLDVVERSYALASKYMPPPSEPVRPSPAGPSAPGAAAVPVVKASDRVVSALPQPVSDSEALERLAAPRNYSFHTAVGSSGAAAHTAIRACVAEDQVIASGGRIKLRLLEAMRAGGTFIPANAEVFGTATVNSQRMSITVTSIEHGGCIIPVELTAHDLDGQPGLFVPNSAERTAVKDAAASIGSGLGSSISFARSAGQQVAMDVVRGAMTGGTQYLASKLREVKVSVKANYQILLVPKK